MSLQLPAQENTSVKAQLKEIKDTLKYFTSNINTTHSSNSHHLLYGLENEINSNIWKLNSLFKILMTKLKYTNSDINNAVYQKKSIKAMLALPQSCQTHIPIASIKKVSRRYLKNSPRGPYRSYSIAEKQHVVDMHILGKTFASISKQLHIPQKNVVRWCRECYAGKPFNNRSADHGVKEKLSFWLAEKCKENIISLEDVMKKAVELAEGTPFVPNQNWVRRVLRHQIPSSRILFE